MNLEKIIAVLLFVVQIANAGMFIIQGINPDVALYVAASIGAIQAFVGKIQASKDFDD